MIRAVRPSDLIVDTTAIPRVGAVASGALGLTVSSLATSQSLAILSVGIYFLALILISGFIFPIQEGSVLIRVLAHLLPLTFILPELRSWMFGAGSAVLKLDSLAWLSGQAVVYGALAALAFGRLLRRV